jgi:hypothetical protein
MSRPTRARAFPLGIAAITAGLSLVTCRSATQITVTVVTDVDCASRPSSLIRVGDVHAIEDDAATATAGACDPASSPHRVGALVITPSGADDQEVAFKVVEAIGEQAEACRGPSYAGCIVARRVLRFIPHTNIDVTVSMLLSCKDVPCVQGMTCVRGQCVPAECSGASCSDPEPIDGGAVDASFADASDASSADASDGAITARCQGNAGPPMVRFDLAAPGASFCIDTTETTNQEFNLFAANPGTLKLPPECANEGALPALQTDPAHLRRPVNYVSFCDAWAYCAWAGKRLCGKIGAGRAENSGNLSNEWVYACSNGTGSPYPYGATYDPSVCNTTQDASASAQALVNVDANPACHGVGPGFSQLLDMIGNVSELDSYSSAVDDAGTYEVQSRGGGATEGAAAQCGALGTFAQYTRTAGDDIGFRCCADVAP